MTHDSINSGDRHGPTRILAVVVRPRGFAFLLVEGTTILDSGIWTCQRSNFLDCLGQRFLRILRTYGPSTLVLRGPRVRPKMLERGLILNAIEKESRHLNVPMVWVRHKAICRYFFEVHHASTKHEIAQVIAQTFLDIAWQLPRKRKPWESEHHRMPIFEAAAALIAHTALQTQQQLASCSQV